MWNIVGGTIEPTAGATNHKLLSRSSATRSKGNKVHICVQRWHAGYSF